MKKHTDKKSFALSTSRKARIAARKTMRVLGTPPIVSAPELQTGAELQARYETLAERFQSLTYDALGDNFELARQIHEEAPSEETFADLKRRSFERSFFRADHTARVSARQVLNAFVVTEVVPWAAAIIERNLALAEGAYRKVKAVENSRVQKLLGRPLTQSDIVEAAERPIKHLERLRESLSRTGPGVIYSPAKILEKFEAVGSERFSDLIAPEFSAEEVEALELEEAERAAGEATALEESEFPAGEERAAP